MRISRTHQARIDTVDDLLALRQEMAEACDVMKIRFDQTGRRAVGNDYLLRVFLPCFGEMTDIIHKLSEMHAILCELRAGLEGNGESPNTR